MSLATILAACVILSNPFVVRITPVVASAGGPIVIDAEVVYLGSKPILVDVGVVGRWNGFEVDLPGGWGVKRGPDRRMFSFGNGHFLMLAKPGETVCRSRIILHEEFVGNIPAGAVSVTVRWANGRVESNDSPIRASGSGVVHVLPTFRLDESPARAK